METDNAMKQLKRKTILFLILLQVKKNFISRRDESNNVKTFRERKRVREEKRRTIIVESFVGWLPLARGIRVPLITHGSHVGTDSDFLICVQELVEMPRS